MIRDGKETQYIFLKDVRFHRGVKNLVNQSAHLASQDIKYDIVPALDHLKCFKTNIGGGTGPTLASVATLAAPSATTTQRRLLHVTPKHLAKLGFVRGWQTLCSVCVGATIATFCFVNSFPHSIDLHKHAHAHSCCPTCLKSVGSATALSLRGRRACGDTPIACIKTWVRNECVDHNC